MRPGIDNSNTARRSMISHGNQEITNDDHQTFETFNSTGHYNRQIPPANYLQKSDSNGTLDLNGSYSKSQGMSQTEYDKTYRSENLDTLNVNERFNSQLLHANNNYYGKINLTDTPNQASSHSKHIPDVRYSHHDSKHSNETSSYSGPFPRKTSVELRPWKRDTLDFIAIK